MNQEDGAEPLMPSEQPMAQDKDYPHPQPIPPHIFGQPMPPHAFGQPMPPQHPYSKPPQQSYDPQIPPQQYPPQDQQMPPQQYPPQQPQSLQVPPQQYPTQPPQGQPQQYSPQQPQSLQVPPQYSAQPPQAIQPVIGQPVTPIAQVPVTQNQPIVVNQVTLQHKFKTDPTTLTCPFCKQTIRTNVDTDLNCANCCLCLMTGVIVWACIMCCMDKDLNCCDATHKCPNCGSIVGNYKAC